MDCCSGFCNANLCQSLMCNGDGVACMADVDWCSGACSMSVCTP